MILNKETKISFLAFRLFQFTAFRAIHPWLRLRFFLYCTSRGRNFLKLYEENRKFTEKVINFGKYNCFEILVKSEIER